MAFCFSFLLDEVSPNGDFVLQNGEKWMLFEFFYKSTFFIKKIYAFKKLVDSIIKLQTNVYDLKFLM